MTAFVMKSGNYPHVFCSPEHEVLMLATSLEGIYLAHPNSYFLILYRIQSPQLQRRNVITTPNVILLHFALLHFALRCDYILRCNIIQRKCNNCYILSGIFA